MAALNTENPFQSWVMTEKESLQSKVLTLLQKQNLQNHIAELANKRINLKLDTTNLHSFMQEDAEYQGQMLILRWLISESMQAELALGLTAERSINL